MPRQPRIEYAGAIYHVMSRGNRGCVIFRDDADREMFLETLSQACFKTGWLIHAYVLMNTHFHILLETPEANLVLGMQWFQSTYTQRFNVRHREFGHLFQGRYKALLIDPDSETYFTVVSSYVHLNPARARLFDLREGRYHTIFITPLDDDLENIDKISMISQDFTLNTDGRFEGKDRDLMADTLEGGKTVTGCFL